MQDLLNLIGNVGFPIAVAAYLLIRIESKLGELTEAITDLRESIITLPGRGYAEGSRAITGDKIMQNPSPTIQSQ